jgi:hypothetical protein
MEEDSGDTRSGGPRSDGPVVSENSAGPDAVTGSGMRHGTIGP